MANTSVEKTSQSIFRTRLFGDFTVHCYLAKPDKDEVFVLTLGDLSKVERPLMRVHSSCLTGDVFGSVLCDCRDQLEVALDRIQREGTGILIYLSQEGRGNGLVAKLKAYELMEKGMDTVDANKTIGVPIDNRSYAAAALILKDQGINKVRFMTNNPDKVGQLEAFGIDVERLPDEAIPNKWNEDYLNTKKARMGHML